VVWAIAEGREAAAAVDMYLSREKTNIDEDFFFLDNNVDEDVVAPGPCECMVQPVAA
jgi:glutamate synthase (NADPH/NADH)